MSFSIWRSTTSTTASDSRHTRIVSPRGSGEICLNGAAARKAMVGDHVIIAAYSTYNEAELAKYRPIVVCVDDQNSPRSVPSSAPVRKHEDVTALRAASDA